MVGSLFLVLELPESLGASLKHHCHSQYLLKTSLISSEHPHLMGAASVSREVSCVMLSPQKMNMPALHHN